MQIILFGCRNRICWWKGCENGRRAWNLRSYSEQWKEEGHEVSGEHAASAVDSGNHPCSVWRQGVGCNSIISVACHRWFHERCSGISGKLSNNVDFHCRICSVQKVVLRKVEIEPRVRVECVCTICTKIVLSWWHIFGSGGGVKEAAKTRMKCVWAKFKELSPILTAHCALYHIKGEIYRACVQTPECFEIIMLLELEQ